MTLLWTVYSNCRNDLRDLFKEIEISTESLDEELTQDIQNSFSNLDKKWEAEEKREHRDSQRNW